jgi:hypothetical protein
VGGDLQVAAIEAAVDRVADLALEGLVAVVVGAADRAACLGRPAQDVNTT